MMHRRNKLTLGRVSEQRKALMRGLADSLILHESIRTTQAKAKYLKRIVEPLVTKAKSGKLSDRRMALKVLYTDKAVRKLMNELAARYQDRKGGYLRIIKLAPRANDAAEMVKIEFV
jgi:large subunit ribosomal protein L17